MFTSGSFRLIYLCHFPGYLVHLDDYIFFLCSESVLSPSVDLLCCCLVAKLCLILCDQRVCSLPGSSVHGIFPGKYTEMSSHFLLQGIFPTEGSNPRFLYLLCCRWILYHWAGREACRHSRWNQLVYSCWNSWAHSDGKVSRVFHLAHSSAGFDYSHVLPRITCKSLLVDHGLLVEAPF